MGFVRTTGFNTSILGTSVHVDLAIKASYEASFNFNLYGSPYTFTVTRWSRRGFAKFATLFFNYAERDAAQFGGISEGADGAVVFNMSTEQKLAIIVQGVKDIMRCLDIIVSKYQRSVLDYAVWYRERCQPDEPYENFITLYACHCIVHSDFLAPNIAWDVVRFE
jgi:hypothetical protein